MTGPHTPDEQARAMALHPTAVHSDAALSEAVSALPEPGESAESPAGPAEVIDLAAHLPSAAKTPLRVAVIDDDPSIRQIVRLVCQRDPEVRCVLAEPGPSTALAGLPTACPDVVLLDLELGVTSGLALVPEIKAACPDAMIVLFSSVSPEDGEDLAAHVGAFGFYEKWALGVGLPARLRADHDHYLLEQARSR